MAKAWVIVCDNVLPAGSAAAIRSEPKRCAADAGGTRNPSR